MPFEDELSEEFRRVGETFELSDSHAVVDAGLVAGRRGLLRRRVAAMTGSVLALALIGVGGAFAGGFIGGAGTTADVAGGQRSYLPGSGSGGPAATESASASAVPTASASPTTAAPSPDRSRTATPERPENGGEKPTAGLPTPPSLDYARLMPTFLKLLPKGLPVVEQNPSGEGEYAYVVVDDGKGRSRVQINVQRDMRDVAGHLYSDATTLPDGTLLATAQEPGEKGGAGVVQWTADTMRPDGMRVVVSAFNSGDQASAATRPEPALTIEQLTALATSTEWLKLQK